MGATACGGNSAHSISLTSPAATTGATGSTATVSTSTVAPEPVKAKADVDKDNNLGVASDEKSNGDVLGLGKAASASEKRAVTTLVKRYYAAAGAEDGAMACAMIYSTLSESIPEDYGQSPPGPPYLHGKTCPAVMTLLFKHLHPQIALELPKLEVVRVRLIEHHGIAVLRFGALPERQISVAREGRSWKIQGLIDSEIP